MDISFSLDGTRINLRVAILLRSPSGYIFEQDRDGFYFPIGGRMKSNEDSETAARREVREEIQVDVSELRITGVIENFFCYRNEPFQEICFVYEASLASDPGLPPGFRFMTADEFATNDIRPATIKELTASATSGVTHRISR